VNLTAFQKQLCIDIAAKKIQRVGDILDHYNLFSVRRYNYPQGHSTNIGGQQIQVHKGASVLVPNDEEFALSRIKEFISLWRLLELNALISTFNTARSLNVAIVRFHNEQHIEFVLPILNILAIRAKDELTPNETLRIFIESDYLTEEEKTAKEAADKQAQRYQQELEIKQVELDLQKEHNTKILFWTRLIGIGSIISSISIAILQFITYTKEREVTITNGGAFKDTVNVIIVIQDNEGANIIPSLKLPLQKENDTSIHIPTVSKNVIDTNSTESRKNHPH
jgi:hypothetical protein